MKRSIISILGLILLSTVAVFAQEVNTSTEVGSVTTSTGKYLIKPGDKIVGKVMGEEDFSFEVIVDENGRFELPFVDKSVVAKCRTQREVKDEVKEHYSRFLRSPLLSVQVTERRKPAPVTVSGEVQQVSQVELTREARLMELLTISGGAKKESAGGIVRVFRTRIPECASSETRKDWLAESDNEKILPSRVFSLSNIESGSKEANPIIYPGDIIVVEKASPVYFVGEVNKRDGIYIRENGLSLTQAIAMVGGTQDRAKTKDIKIYRLKGNSPMDREAISVNLEDIQDGKAADVMLQPYDIIDVEKKKKSMAQTVLEVVTGVGRSALSSVGTGGVSRILY